MAQNKVAELPLKESSEYRDSIIEDVKKLDLWETVSFSTYNISAFRTYFYRKIEKKDFTIKKVSENNYKIQRIKDDKIANT